ncbi:MAG TPA: IS200/IS605 family transposase [Armatimonadota bacterium]|jgi:REP element-mobilizing transposase RayT
MGQSLIRVYVHFVWATAQRQPLLGEAARAAVFRCVAAEAAKLGCEVLAIGGVEHHVHVLLRTPPLVDLPRLAQQMKGVSSHVARSLPGGAGFGWQDGYAALSVSPNHVGRVRDYVCRQAERHAAGHAHAEWEATE